MFSTTYLKFYRALLKVLETSFIDHLCTNRICMFFKLLMGVEVDTILWVIWAFEIMYFQFPKNKPHSK